jgi:hypothetical protein
MASPDTATADAAATAAAAAASASRKRKRASLAKDLPSMMYGFGDSAQPNQESMAVLESLVVDHVANLTKAAQNVAELKGGQVDAECFVFLVRKNVRKFSRIKVCLVHLACEMLHV